MYQDPHLVQRGYKINACCALCHWWNGPRQRPVGCCSLPVPDTDGYYRSPRPAILAVGVCRRYRPEPESPLRWSEFGSFVVEERASRDAATAGEVDRALSCLPMTEEQRAAVKAEALRILGGAPPSEEG